MKTKILFQSVLIACFLAFGTISKAQTIQKNGYQISLNQEKSAITKLTYNLGRYKIDQIEKSGVVFSKITTENKINSNKKGWAELPFMNTPIQISDSKNVSVKVVSSEFEEIQLSNPLLPSRGTITRNQNPSEIPYVIDAYSIKDEWYPANLVESCSPYIVKDIRGTDIKISAFQYNSAKNILRVYKSVTVEVVENETKPINAISKQTKIANKEMNSIYKSLFVNYKENTDKWINEIREFGDILVIYTSRDASVIQPWITWKKQMGYNVYEQQVATGTNVKSAIQTAYDANNNIFYVQLVGDWADIKSDLGTSGNAPMDPMMGCVVGTDDHHDIIIGRFSASTTAAITVQVNKAINYEKNPEIGGTWYSKGLGIGSAEGPGDDNEIDQDHINNIKVNKLVPYTYSGTVTEAYGASVATSTVANAINNGVGIINYCGHGDHDLFVTSNYDVTAVNASTNGSKLPFVFSVACIAGEFHTGTDCLAEGMLKKENGGALAVWMSTINQPWDPPMRGQDYANDLLTEGFTYSSGAGTSTTYGKTTYGSVTFNAAALMVGESATTDDWETYKTWTIFGDASVQLRTTAPKTITIANPNVTPGSYTTQITVDGVAFKNALVSLYSSSSTQPFSALTDASGNVTITHTLAGTCKLTVTGYNLATYSADKVIGTPVAPICDFSANSTTITRGQSVSFNDLSQNYPASWAWTFEGGTPATSTSSAPVIAYNTVGTYAVSLTVTNAAGNDTKTKVAYITVNEISTPPVTNFSTSATTIAMGQSVDFTDLSTNLPNAWAWTFEGGTPSSSTSQNPTGIVYSAAGTYAVTLISTNNIGSDTETKTSFITVSAPVYCDAASLSLDYEYISKVQIANINKTSAAALYSDFTSTSTDLYVDSTFSISVNITLAYDSDQILVFADWNHDGDYEDLGENVYTSAQAGTAGDVTFTSTISVPTNALIGTTHLRVRLHDIGNGPNANPCGNSDFGEVEDYSINVLSKDPVLANEIVESDNLFNIYPNPTNGILNFRIDENEMQNANINIFNSMGQIVYSNKFEEQINIEKLPKGFYLINIISNDKNWKRSIIKE